MNGKKTNKLKDDNPQLWANYLGLGTQLAVTILAMVFLGIWLDGKFSTTPVLTLVFSFIGIFGGLYNFIKSTIKSDK